MIESLSCPKLFSSSRFYLFEIGQLAGAYAAAFLPVARPLDHFVCLANSVNCIPRWIAWHAGEPRGESCTESSVVKHADVRSCKPYANIRVFCRMEYSKEPPLVHLCDPADNVRRQQIRRALQCFCDSALLTVPASRSARLCMVGRCSFAIQRACGPTCRFARRGPSTVHLPTALLIVAWSPTV